MMFGFLIGAGVGFGTGFGLALLLSIFGLKSHKDKQLTKEQIENLSKRNQTKTGL